LPLGGEALLDEGFNAGSVGGRVGGNGNQHVNSLRLSRCFQKNLLPGVRTALANIKNRIYQNCYANVSLVTEQGIYATTFH
jgi:hypothetical protein